MLEQNSAEQGSASGTTADLLYKNKGSFYRKKLKTQNKDKTKDLSIAHIKAQNTDINQVSFHIKCYKLVTY